MSIKDLFRRIRWQINAIRHRDPLSPRLYYTLFGSWRRRPWEPNRVPRRVVVLRSDEIGDTVTTTTLLSAMRAQWPKATVHLVVKPGPATIFHALGTVDRVVPWTPITEGSALKRQVLTARQSIRRFRLRGYDLAILPRWDFDDTPLRYLAVATRARSIIGFAPVPTREPDWLGDQSRLLTDVIERGAQPLLTVQQLERVAGRIGVTWPEKFVPPAGQGLFDAADLARTRTLAPVAGDARVTVGVGIGARDAKRQWPVDSIVTALENLSRSHAIAVRILGGAVDQERSVDLCTKLRERELTAVDLSGRLSLSESAAAISECDIFLGNDSGLQHIASSLDVPTVVTTCHPASGSPWSDNAPERFGPWATRSAVLQPAVPAGDCGDECEKNYAHCILAVRPDEVSDALVAELGQIDWSRNG